MSMMASRKESLSNAVAVAAAGWVTKYQPL